MKYYTSTIPITLAEKLKDKGMIGEEYISDRYTGIPKYCEVFDWLMNNRLSVNILGYNNEWQGAIHVPRGCFYASIENTWHEAANAAIEKALELIKED